MIDLFMFFKNLSEQNNQLRNLRDMYEYDCPWVDPYTANGRWRNWDGYFIDMYDIYDLSDMIDAQKIKNKINGKYFKREIK